MILNNYLVKHIIISKLKMVMKFEILQIKFYKHSLKYSKNQNENIFIKEIQINYKNYNP